MGKYINPFTDWGFKRLFGQDFSKDLLISFLNDLFEGELLVKKRRNLYRQTSLHLHKPSTF